MALTMDDGATIFALSTGGLPSAIAIIRLSGPESGPVLEALIGRKPEERPRVSFAEASAEMGPAEGALRRG